MVGLIIEVVASGPDIANRKLLFSTAVEMFCLTHHNLSSILFFRPALTLIPPPSFDGAVTSSDSSLDLFDR